MVRPDQKGVVVKVKGLEGPVAWHRIAPISSLKQQEPTLVLVDTKQVLLVRRGEDVVACDPICPHKFTSLEDGHLEGDCLVCPLHDAHFHLTDGRPREGDEWAGTLPVYPCRVEDGMVEVVLE